MASAFLWSEAFISTMPQENSFASACAMLVFPIPGGPMRITALSLGCPASQARAQSLSSATAFGLPSTSLRLLGR